MDSASRCFALILGITQFSARRFQNHPLPQAANDAADLQDALVGWLKWDPRHIIMLSGPITREQIRDAFRDAAARVEGRSDALFLFYLSTHGDLIRDGQGDSEPILLCADTNLETYYEALDSGMPRGFISQRLRGIPTRQVVLISDACYAAGPTNPEDFRPQSFYRSFDVHVIGASVSQALIKAGARNSLFTSCLVQAIRASERKLDTHSLFSATATLLNDLEPGAPEPFNNALGGRIVLGEPAARASADTVLTNCLQQLAVKSRDRYSGSRYVSRKPAETGFYEFLSSSRRCFTVVGKAGSGKSTLSLHLAEVAVKRGYPAVWLEGQALPVKRTAAEIVDDELRGMGVESLDELSRLCENKPLLIFVDAINECNGSAEDIRMVCQSFLEAARGQPLRIFASCREIAWPSLAEPFVNQVYLTSAEEVRSGISIPLSGYDERELEQARRLYPIPEALARDPIAMEPLFLNMLAQLAGAGLQSGEPSLASVFHDYVDFKVRRIAARLSRPPAEIDKAIDILVAAMDDEIGESLPAATYDSLVPPPVAYALLDEGLFRQTAQVVTVEAEQIHEYLLSRVLPDDWFAAAPRKSGYFRLWWGAAAFRLLRIEEPIRVLEFLHSITDANQMLAIMPKLPSHPHYAAFREEFLRTVVRRIHEWFLEINYYDWEPKRWRNVEYEAFRRRLKTDVMVTEAAPPQLLAHLFDEQPAFAFSTVLREWLGDRSALEGGVQSTIADVATIFLSQFATQNPRMCLQAVEDMLPATSHMRRVESSDLSQVLLSAATQAPEEAAVYVVRWLDRGWIALAVPLLKGMTDRQEPLVLPAIARALSGPSMRFASAGDALVAAGTFGSAGVLALAESYLHDSILGADAIAAIQGVAWRHPRAADAAIGAFVAAGGATPETHQALVYYAGSRVAAEPKLAIWLFDKILAAAPRKCNFEIAAACLKVERPGPELAQFVERRLSQEVDALPLEYYARLVVRYRPLAAGDLPWIRRWTDTHPDSVWGLLRMLSQSEVPLNDQIAIYAALDAKQADFIGQSVSSYGREPAKDRQILAPYATLIVSHPDFPLLSRRTQGWFTAVSQEFDPNEAYHRMWSKRREPGL